MTNLLQSVGGQPQKPTHFVSLFTSRFLTGIYTNRSLLRGPLQSIYSDFYHLGTTDALCDGLNSELSIRQTMTRRPGNPQFCNQNTNGAIDNFYSFHKSDGTISVIADSTVDVEVITPTTLTSIFTKTTGAGQGYFQGVNQSLYIADGIDLVKYIPGTNNPDTGKPVWNMGGVAPAVAPTLSITATTSAGLSWIASTFFSTMGFLWDSGTNTIQQLYTINADGSNANPTPGNTGKSGTGVPNWSQSYLATTNDGSVVWTNYGQILPWQPNHLYAGGDPIYDPTTKCVFITSHNYNVTSGGVYPSFTAVLGINGARVTESTGARWENIGIVESWAVAGQPTCIRLWATSKAYNKYDPPVNGTGGGDPTTINCATVEPNANLPSTAANPVYLQAATTAGTTGGATAPKWGITAGALTQDGQLGYVCLGNSTTTSATWAAGTAYSAWTPGGVFSALKDANGNFQVCIVTGNSGALIPGTVYNISSCANASAGNTTYTGTFTPVNLPVGSPVTIAGFVTNPNQNNGRFKVISCNNTTLVVNNPNGIAETVAATVTYNPWGTTYGAAITEGTVTWTCVGSAAQSTWAATTQWFLPPNGFTPPSGSQPYGSSTVTDSNTNTEFVVSSALSGGSAPAWAAVGNYTAEGSALTLTQVAVSGNQVTYTGTITGGGSNAFAGFTFYITGFTNVTNNGLINVTASTATTLVCIKVAQVNETHAATAATGLIWYDTSAFVAAGTSWTKNRGYVFAFKARTTADIFNTTPPPLQIPNTNSPNILGPLGQPTGAQDGTVTTASPVAQIIGGNTGAQVLITGKGSVDPQFDTVVIYRAADGFAASGPYLFMTEINMPPRQSLTVPGTWNVVDFMPDTASNVVVGGVTTVLPGLDQTSIAPIAHLGDPPPGSPGSVQFTPSASNPNVAAAGTALIGLTYHQGRMWGHIGNNVYVSEGPDATPYNGFTNAWPPGQVFPFSSTVIKLVPTATALLVFTTTDAYLIGGGPSISTYYSQLLAPGVGLLSWNGATMVLGLPYLFTSDRQFITIDPSGGFTRIGHPIGDKLSAYNPTTVYVTYHSFGDQEHALFISDGSTEWYRCDPNPTPDAQITGPVWSPRATISGGFQAIQSIETSPGVKNLLIGPAGVGKILNRDSTFTTFTDNGSAYSSFFTMGNIVLAHAGQMAELSFVEADFIQTGSQPSVLVLLDELSATNGAVFESISNSFVTDPPKKFGPTAVPATMWMNRYNFAQTTPGNGGDQTPVSAWCKSLQIKVDFGNTDTVQNELLAFTIFGALWQEK